MVMRACIVAAVLTISLGALAPVPAVAQRVDIQATNKRYQAFYAQGNYTAALAEARKLEATVRALGGTQHANYPVVLEFVGNSLAGQGNYAEAEAVYKRVLAIRADMYGETSTEAADALNNLANNNLKQGRYPEAEAYYKRASEIYREAKGPDSPDLAFILNNMSVVYENQGNYRQAEATRKHVLAVYEKAYGADHPNVADAVSKLASLYQTTGRNGEAEALFKRAIAVQQRPDLDQIPAARTLNNLAIMYFAVGKHSDAEVNFKRAITIEEKVLGPGHPVVAEALQNLAAVLKSQCRYDESINLAKRVISIREKTLGPRHPDLASTLVNLANVYALQEKYSDGDPLYRRALSIQEETLGSEHPNVSFTLHNLGYAAEAQHRYDEAEAFDRKALAIRDRALGSNHPQVAVTLNNLGNVLTAQKKFDDADEAFSRAWSIYTQTVGANHPDAALTANNLARLAAARGDAKAALEWSRRSTNALLAATVAASSNEQGGQGCLVEQRSTFFATRIDAAAAAARAGIEPKAALTAEAFEMAQWANHSSAAAALQQMGTRFAAGTDALAVLVRQSQDLAASARERDKAMIAAMSKPVAQQDSEAIAKMRDDIVDLQQKLAAINARLEKEFPNYAALTSPKPLSVKDAQGLLGADEALIVWIAGEKQTELFAIAREGVEWHTLPLTSEALSQKVTSFRRGLDVAAVNAKPSEQFDLVQAHTFYKELMGPIEPLVKRKRNLLVVPSGALTAVPFPLLVTEPPASSAAGDMSAYRDAAWLAKQNAVTVVPSVPSLKSLRVLARANDAAKPLVGFGDPVFQSGAPPASGDQRSVRAKKATQSATRAVVKTRAYADFWQGASVDPSRLGDALPPLPDTADEIKDVAGKLGASAGDVFLGAAASETNLKSLTLADYRIVYFATHGLVAGDVKGLAEPSLALTIPKISTALDDGLLTASEVAQLKLSADWVVLSACNTIAGDKPGAEALSGLARAFFYAGARALLVTHWAVASDAATTLATTTFANLQADPKLGRAEALRRATVTYLNDPAKPQNAYPAFWGAFSIVGEGVLR